MKIYECFYPNCGSQCGQSDTPPCTADQANEVAELQRQVGEEMIKITTTVVHKEEWLAIPHIWQLVADERDWLRERIYNLENERDSLNAQIYSLRDDADALR